MKIEHIASVAARLAERNGWHKVSLEALAAEMDVSRMTVSRAGMIGGIRHEAAKVVQQDPHAFPRAFTELALDDMPVETRLAVVNTILGVQNNAYDLSV